MVVSDREEETEADNEEEEDFGRQDRALVVTEPNDDDDAAWLPIQSSGRAYPRVEECENDADDDAGVVIDDSVGPNDVRRRGAVPGTPCAAAAWLLLPPLPPRKSSGRPTPTREADEEADEADPREEIDSFGRLLPWYADILNEWRMYMHFVINCFREI